MTVTVCMTNGAQHLFSVEPSYYAGLGMVQFTTKHGQEVIDTMIPLCNIERIEIIR